MDLAIQAPDRASPPRGLRAISSMAELPPYIAEVVKAVAEGVRTWQELAKVSGVSISNASQRYRVA